MGTGFYAGRFPSQGERVQTPYWCAFGEMQAFRRSNRANRTRIELESGQEFAGKERGEKTKTRDPSSVSRDSIVLF
jgi:hypothetical protein